MARIQSAHLLLILIAHCNGHLFKGVSNMCPPKRSVLPLICKGIMVFVRIITYSANPCILGTDWDSAHFSIPLLSHADNGRREGGIILKALGSFLFCEACS